MKIESYKILCHKEIMRKNIPKIIIDFELIG